MKKLIFLPIAAALFIAFPNCTRSNKTCCGEASTTAFAELGQSKTFQDAHPAPLPDRYRPCWRNDRVSVEDGKMARAYLVKKNDENRYLMLFHEWWGLNDYIKNEADFYANALGINVLCPDSYDGQLATDAEAAGKLMGGNDKERSAAIIHGAYKNVGEGSTVTTMGWCFGGGWSCQAAIIGGAQVNGCVIYYGMPEEDVAKLATLNCDVLGIFAEKDEWMNRAVVAKFEENMKSAGRPLTVKWYPADHAFANPSSPRFREKAAQEARAATISYLKGRK